MLGARLLNSWRGLRLFLLPPSVGLFVLYHFAVNSSTAKERDGCFAALKKIAWTIDPGFRLPAEADVSGWWAFHRDEHGTEASCTQGDFNGDGLTDYASILIARSGKGFGIVGLLSVKGGRYTTISLLKEQGDVFAPQDARLDTLMPGKHDDLFTCTADQKANQTIRLRHAGIDYFSRQDQWLRGLRTADVKSAHKIFYWENGDLRTMSLCAR